MDGDREEYLNESSRQQGVVHRTIEEMAIPGFFASDEEFEEFQAMLRWNRGRE